MRLTFVLPQLIWPEPEDKAALEGLACPGLEWLLAHGTRTVAPPRAYEDALAALFGLPANPPFGALRLLGEASLPVGPGAREGFWLCADPVHLRFHHERIILADAGAFELSDEEALTLAAGLNAEFADIGEFHVAETRRWYVRLKTHSEFASPPLSAVAGRRIDGELPDAPQAARLRSWLNEVQMFLHGHPVNASRASAGKPAVNSLWLWGAGPLAEPARSPGQSVYGDDPLAAGLARAAGIPVQPLPPRLADVLAQATGSGLVVLDQLLPPVIYEDSRGWRDRMEKLEGDWFAPLRSALGRRVDELALIAPTVYGLLEWQLTGADRWKFWRRPRPLMALAQELAR